MIKISDCMIKRCNLDHKMLIFFLYKVENEGPCALKALARDCGDAGKQSPALPGLQFLVSKGEVLKIDNDLSNRTYFIGSLSI